MPIYNLMEDAATAEISRSQVWQWVRHGARLKDGREVTSELVRRTIAEELDRLRSALGPERFDGGEFAQASRIFGEIMTDPKFTEFMTLVAYDYID